MHEKTTFSPLKVTFSPLKTTFTAGTVTNTNYSTKNCYF